MARSLLDITDMPLLPDGMFWRLDWDGGIRGVYTLLAMSPRRFGPPKKEEEITITGRPRHPITGTVDRFLLHGAQEIIRRLQIRYSHKAETYLLSEYEGDHR